MEQLSTSNMVGVVALAYIVIKEVFVLVKGDTKYTARKVDEIHALVSQASTSIIDVHDKVAYLYKRNKDMEIFISTLCDKLDDLWKWHAKEDDEGVKIWYVRKTLGDAISELSGLIIKFSSVISDESVLLEKVLGRLESLESTKNVEKD